MDKVKHALKLAAERMSLVDVFDRKAYYAIQDALAELEWQTLQGVTRCSVCCWNRESRTSDYIILFDTEG